MLVCPIVDGSVVFCGDVDPLTFVEYIWVVLWVWVDVCASVDVCGSVVDAKIGDSALLVLCDRVEYWVVEPYSLDVCASVVDPNIVIDRTMVLL